MKIFIVDIDGTLCEDVPNERPWDMVDAMEIMGARDWLNAFYEEGHYICLFTARTSELQLITENWLKEHDFHYHQIIYNKPRKLGYEGYFYVDNSHIQASTFPGRYHPFEKKMKEIETF